MFCKKLLPKGYFPNTSWKVTFSLRTLVPGPALMIQRIRNDVSASQDITQAFTVKYVILTLHNKLFYCTKSIKVTIIIYRSIDSLCKH